MDRETLIGAIEQRKRIAELNNQAFVELPYEIVGDAIAMLKEQEADMIALKNAYKELAEKGSVIVRCKDCKHGDLWSDENVIVCDKLSKTRNKNWFCADGERR